MIESKPYRREDYDAIAQAFRNLAALSVIQAGELKKNLKKLRSLTEWQ